MPGLRGLSQWHAKKQGKLEKAVLKPRRGSTAEADPDFAILAKRIGESNARIVTKWQKRGLAGSSPELLVYDWLTRRRIEFEFQSSLYGGRQVAGGLVTDFIVWVGADPMAWRIQGEHWHTGAVVEAKDKANAIRMLMTTYGGRKFIACVDLWESDLYRDHNGVCEEALRGRGLRD